MKRSRNKFLRSFSPVARRDARVLILGTMPGEESLRQRRYYAHRQNAFWFIMGELFGARRELPYRQRLARLRAHRIALWDVVAQCQRAGSMDGDIDERSLRPNNMRSLFRRCSRIRTIVFNGHNAARLYRRWVLPHLPARFRALPTVTLPSTSPAAARLSRSAKLKRWRAILRELAR